LLSRPTGAVIVPDTKSETAMPRTNDAALAAFIARKTEIDAPSSAFRVASDDHVFTSPEDVDPKDRKFLRVRAAKWERLRRVSGR
jgi:hypothetical protein